VKEVISAGQITSLLVSTTLLKNFMRKVYVMRSKSLIKVVMLAAIVVSVLSAFSALPSRAQSKPSGEITVWMWKSNWDNLTNSKILDDFAKEYPDIKINRVDIAAGDVYQKLPLAISAGTGAPDVSLVEDSALGRFVALGGLADLTEKTAPYKDQIVGYKWDQVTKDGKVYGMPWDFGPVVTYYRRDIFKAAGFSDDPAEVSKLVATWDSYLATCKTILEKTGKMCFPLSKANNDARWYEVMLWQQGLGYVSADGKVTVDSPENIATLEKMGEFFEAGVVADQQSWTDTWYAQFNSKDEGVASTVMAAWMGGFMRTWLAPETKGLWGVTEMPAMKEGQARAANDGGSNFIIPEQSANKDAAWAFVEFMLARPESQVKIFSATDIFPALTTTYNDPVFTEADEYFGGQKVREVYTNIASTIPAATIYGEHYSEINGFVQTAIQTYLTGAATAEEALKAAAEQIRQQTGLE
jgi:lactose/L-arabinose transport system substrate-binding protein